MGLVSAEGIHRFFSVRRENLPVGAGFEPSETRLMLEIARTGEDPRAHAADLGQSRISLSFKSTGFRSAGYSYSGIQGVVTVSESAAPGWVHGISKVRCLGEEVVGMPDWFGPQLINGLRVRPSHVDVGTTVNLSIRGADIHDKDVGFSHPGIRLNPAVPIERHEDEVALEDELIASVIIAPDVPPGFLYDVIVGGETLQGVLHVIKVEYVTKGENDSIVPQLFSFNSLPTPQIEITESNCVFLSNNTAVISISGKVLDAASDLIDIPSKQLQNTRQR